MPADDSTIREFEVGFSDAELAELRRRIKATRWPEKETVDDDSQGVRSGRPGTLPVLGRRLRLEQVEATLNAFPQFGTEIDGLDIHFLHVRSEHEDALPLVMTHGWPGSFVEFLKVIGPLTDPGPTAADPARLPPGDPVAARLRFSAKPTAPGWDPVIAVPGRMIHRLGYAVVAQGGDWGATVTQTIGIRAEPRAAWHPLEYAWYHAGRARERFRARRSAAGGSPRPAELRAYEQLRGFYAKHVATHRSWRHVRRRYMGWRTHRSISRPSCSTTATVPVSPAWSKGRA